jgi:hypothetical protein
MMKTVFSSVACLLLAGDSLAAREGLVQLHPNDHERLRAAQIEIVHRVLNGTEHNGTDHAFEITAKVPEGFDSLDATFEVRNDKGLVAYSNWLSSDGKCVAVFMVGQQALDHAVFTVKQHQGDRFAPFGAGVGYFLKLSEFGSKK